ncbi:MAG: universal stress protein [Planctomycetes bacterium]|nr:universal stress protein [Planctomycetota bacterium]
MEHYKNIVAAVDFSECAAAALEQAIRLATVSGAKASAVFVLDTLAVVQLEKALTPLQSSIREQLVEDARKAWSAFATRIPGASGLAFHVAIDNRIVGLHRRIAKECHDLLVLGAFGARRPDLGLGTMASGCVRHAPCDVLIVRDTQRGRFKKVLACVDYSQTSLKALRRAASIARADGAQLEVLHVFHGMTDVFPFFSDVVQTWMRVVSEEQSRATAELEAFVREADIAAANPMLRVEGATTHGAALIQRARETRADLLVLGTKGQSNLKEVLLGSTAERVLRGASCSILAVRAIAE